MSQRKVRRDGDPSSLYMQIAESALKDLAQLTGQIEGGGATVSAEGIRWRSPSAHFEHAVIATVFAAFCVEYELARLVTFRWWLQIRRDRKTLDVHLSKRPTRRQIREFLRAATTISEDDIKAIEELMRHRDRFAHAHFDRKPDKLVREGLPGSPPVIERNVRFPEITTRDVVAAKADVEIAKRVGPLLRQELSNSEWEPGLPVHTNSATSRRSPSRPNRGAIS